jgi:uroporphyrinogen-III decarboxylase
MIFAAHYVGEPLSRYYQDYRVLCEANLATQHAFGLDIVQSISDPFREAADFGANIDCMVDVRKAAQAFGDGPALCGNFNPVSIMLQGSPEHVHQAVTESAIAGGHKSISAAGCEIPDRTPYQNLRAQAQALRQLDTANKE